MIFLDIFLYVYLLVCAAAFLFVTFFDYVTGTGVALGYCLSDSCFTYIFIPLLQIGNALVNKHFQPMQLCRIGDKKVAARMMLLHNLAVAFAVNCIYLSMIILYRTFVLRLSPVSLNFFENYLAFALGAVLVVFLTTGLRFVVPTTMESNVPMMVWIFAVLELKAMIPVLIRQSFKTPNLCFSWLFRGTPLQAAIIVFLLCALSVGLIMYRTSRRDWM